MRVALNHKHILILAIVLFRSNVALANRCETLFFEQRIQSDQISQIPTRENGPGFIVPNETGIGGVASTLKTATPGIYVSVGTERGFMSAALVGAAVKSLVLVDVDPRVNLFNLVNKSLLEIARNREDYLELRLRASYEITAQRANESTTLSHTGRALLTNPEVWTWWVQNVQRYGGFHDFHDSRQRHFQGANYLFDDALFNSISSLAKQGQIFVYQENLTSPEFQTRLLSLAQAQQTRVGVFDISNAWDYIGPAATRMLLQSFGERITPQTLLVFTYLTASPNPHLVSSTFKYWITRDGDLKSSDELVFTLGALKRLDPSHVRSNRSRMSRFGFED